MSSYHPVMKIKSKITEEVDDMYSVHGHAGNLCRVEILECLRTIIKSRPAYQTGQPVSIADFGTADGRASLSLFNEMIDIIQTDLGKEQDVIVYYNDQPMNDFNLLSKVIQGKRQYSGLTCVTNVYPMIVPRTMFAQCIPENTLDLAMSAVATHYLSKKVCQIKNGVFLTEADDIERGLMREQARADWRSFVISRGRELKPGGFLVTMNISSDENGEASLLVDKGLLQMGSMVSDMAREGVITQEEYLATNYNSYYLRTAADFKEPFTSGIPEVGELGLELVSVKSMRHYLKHPTFDIVNKDEAEKLEYSRGIVATVYPWMHHVLHEGLSVSRTEDEKQMIIDQYFNRLQTYAFDNSDHKPYIHFTGVVIKNVH
ncbi:probable S-adenosylmethionine-dependent methyltransferase At5g38780 [Mizuhopecten yessoensis]|uniref:S-adenosylmethionine-dependent methyltransferase At5g38780 n=1 Tax=Mizuhopecten yessoensis TaxID=6573 RepID=A0A210Q5H9_MIZYE|nr:probable S-adenosylmethionine-dependent methyltransferase At5g38780 [Mizuhopecten yessoensis]XP_021366666.1 probable S-adenosylmethionine-dependent methyltransferase At5g38780 [Mizuhopecten yessoensis]OWF43990.1 S-adenosylmethionine-dependent methyltransferase At5g38780 [Mizuhopecten yessoensis]